MRIQEEPVGVCHAEHPLLPCRYQRAERLSGDLSRQADSHAVGKDDFADKDVLPCVVVDTHEKKLKDLAHRFLTNLGLLVIEVASIHPYLYAEGPGRQVALKKVLTLRSECVYRFHSVPYLSTAKLLRKIYEEKTGFAECLRRRLGKQMRGFSSGCLMFLHHNNAFITPKRGNLRFLCGILRKIRNLWRFENYFLYLCIAQQTL